MVHYRRSAGRRWGLIGAIFPLILVSVFCNTASPNIALGLETAPRIGRVCEAILQEIGSWIPLNLRCPCKETRLKTARSTFKVNADLHILPDLNEEMCSGAKDSPECRPLQTTIPGVAACELGGLDVVLPDEAMARSHFTADEWSAEVMNVVWEEYRNYTCRRQQQQQGEWQPFCADASQRVPGDVLDFGADPSGQQLRHLSEKVQGNVVGYNVKHEWYRPATSEYGFGHPGNFTFVWGSAGGCLPFPDASFDYVYSVNVLEHAVPMEKVLSEVLRVLKPGGLFHARWYPNFFSARGHHIHEDMVHAFAKKFGDEGGGEGCYKIQYENNGKMVPDWAHLYMGPEEYREALMQTKLRTCPALVDYIVETALLDPGLSRVNIWQVLQFIESTGLADVSKFTFDPSIGHGENLYYHVVKRIAEKYGNADVLLAGAELWVTRRDVPMPPFELRLGGYGGHGGRSGSGAAPGQAELQFNSGDVSIESGSSGGNSSNYRQQQQQQQQQHTRSAHGGTAARSAAGQQQRRQRRQRRQRY